MQGQNPSLSARYYNSDLSIWISVDPLVDKYPNLSPYTYCAGNPVRLVDEEGKEIWIGGYLYTQGANCPKELTGDDAKAWHSLNSINEHKIGGKVVSALCNSKKKYSISTGYMGENSNYDANKNSATGKKGECGGTINIIESVTNMDQTLSHELFHAYQDDNGQYGNTVHNEVEAYMFEAICNKVSAPLAPKENYPIEDKYVKAFLGVKQWEDKLPISEDEFNNVFRPIRNEFLSKSAANADGTYTNNGCNATYIPKKNLLRELIFQK